MTSNKFVTKLVTGVFFVNFFIYILVVVSLYQIRQQTVGQAALTTQNLAQTLATDLDGFFDKIDVALFAVANEAERLLAAGGVNDQDLNAYIVRQHAKLQELDSMRFAGADGIMTSGSPVPLPPYATTVDREYFKELRDNPQSAVVISKPLKGRITGKWVIIVARRVNNPGGSFAGAVYAIVELEYFARHFSSLNVGKHGAISLRDNGNAVIVRYPESEKSGSAIGHKQVSAELLERLKLNPASGTYSALVKLDHIKRTISYRKISHFPLYIFVGEAPDDYLGLWWKEAAAALSLLALFTLVTIISVRSLIRNRTKEMLALEALSKSETRYRTLIDTIPDMVWLKDPNGVYLSCNKMFERCFGAREKDIVGKIDNDFVGRNLADFYRENDLKAIVAGTCGSYEEMYAFADDGHLAIIDSIKTPLFDAEGDLVGVLGVGRDITARKLTEEKLLKLSKVVEQIPVSLVITDLNGYCEYVNPAFCLLTGYTAEELIGSNLRILKSGKTTADEYRRLWETIIGGGTWQGEFCNKRKNGELYFESACIAPIVDNQGVIKNFVAIKEDITENKQAEKTLRESEKRFRTLIEEAPIAIAVVRNLEFLYVNRVHAKIFGYDGPEQLVGSCLTSRISPKFKEDVVACVAQIFEGKINSSQIEGIGIRKDGAQFPYHISITRIILSDGPVFLFFGTDNSERQKSRKLMIQSEKMMMIGGLAAGVAHEINNPLSTIIQGIQNMIRRFSPTLRSNRIIADEIGLELDKVLLYMEQREISSYLEHMRKAADRASYIATNLLQFSQQGKIPHQNADINDILDQSIDLASTDVNLRKKYNFKSIGITREYDLTLPKILLSITEIEQVIINLLKNSAQAMFTAGTESPAITISTFRSGEYVAINVKDNGPGISEEVRQSVFDPFFTTKGIGLGTGLGLSVSHAIITNNHGGTIDVESEPGCGASFTIHLPIPVEGENS